MKYFTTLDACEESLFSRSENQILHTVIHTTVIGHLILKYVSFIYPGKKKSLIDIKTLFFKRDQAGEKRAAEIINTTIGFNKLLGQATSGVFF